MQDAIGTIVDDFADGGKPGIESNSSGNDNAEKRSREPESIFGDDFIEPEPVGSTARSGRTTAAGRIDKRSRAYRESIGRSAPGGSTAADTGRKTEKVSPSLNVAELIHGIHQMAAAFLKTPELTLDQSEARQWEEMLQKANKYHPMAFDPKKVFYCEFAIFLGTVYGTRFVAINERRKRERGPKLTVMDAPKTEKPKQHVNGKAQVPNIDLSKAAPSDVFGMQSGAVDAPLY